jgi:hypothetical protein
MERRLVRSFRSLLAGAVIGMIDPAQVSFSANQSVYMLHVPLIFVMVHLAASLFGIGQLSPHIPLPHLRGDVPGARGQRLLFPSVFEANTARVRQSVKVRLFMRVDTVRTARQGGARA